MESNAFKSSKSALWIILFESIILRTDSMKNNKASALETFFDKQIEANS